MLVREDFSAVMAPPGRNAVPARSAST